MPPFHQQIVNLRFSGTHLDLYGFEWYSYINKYQRDHEMNVFDFDKTIYKNDSTVDFWKWCLRRNGRVRRRLPKTALYGISFIFHAMTKTEFKERFFGFLSLIDDIDSETEAFWNAHEKGINTWYRNMHKPDDVVISASPRFLLEPICRRLGISVLIASEVDKKTGRYSGVNCDGEEKAVRYEKKFGKRPIDEFYSDSYSDTPLAKLAYNPILVLEDGFEPWDENKLGNSDGE